MAHLEDISKYAAKVDELAVAGMSKSYALVMGKADTKFVAASDPIEVQRVVDNFCKKKLGRTESTEVLTEAVKSVLNVMKAERNKSRIVVYYLLAEHFGQLSLFHPKKK